MESRQPLTFPAEGRRAPANRIRSSSAAGQRGSCWIRARAAISKQPSRRITSSTSAGSGKRPGAVFRNRGIDTRRCHRKPATTKGPPSEQASACRASSLPGRRSCGSDLSHSVQVSRSERDAVCFISRKVFPVVSAAERAANATMTLLGVSGWRSERLMLEL